MDFKKNFNFVGIEPKEINLEFFLSNHIQTIVKKEKKFSDEK